MDTAKLRTAPVILGVDDDIGSLGTLDCELSKPYGQDCMVPPEASPSAALATLTRLRHEDRTVALLLAAQRLAAMEGVELLVPGPRPAPHPHTDWLPPGIKRDDWDFIRTGADPLHDGEPPASWPLKRQPMLLETSVFGIFAAGDVTRSVKRVASAVGAGATAVQLLHDYLATA